MSEARAATVVLQAVESAVAPMMEDEASLTLFLVATIALSLVAAVVLPHVLRRLPLKTSVPALAVVGPSLAIVGGGIGTGTMTLSGHEVWYSLAVSAGTGAAAIVVGLRLARPVARDLDRVAMTIESVAGGDRQARTGIDRSDEIGRLAGAVDELGRSLIRVEIERESAEEERRAVVGALSHDLRSPLASLLASVDALADGVGEPSAHLRAMRGNVLALDSLVDDLFLLARADSGRLALVRESIDVAELIDEAVEAVRPLAAAHEVRVVTRIGVGPLVEGDHRSLGRVLRNLLDNAIRHSPPGAAVLVSAATEKGRVRVEVVDSGPGFPPEFIARAFDRFTQVDDARGRAGSAGLGLAIARTLVQAHAGTIAILPGPGGHVCFDLPVSGVVGGGERGLVGAALSDGPDQTATRSGGAGVAVSSTSAVSRADGGQPNPDSNSCT